MIRLRQRACKARGLAYVNSLKTNQPCKDCSGKFPTVCMDYDHRPGSKKFLNVSRMLTHSKARIDAEIAKCDLVCSNCHRVRTASRLNAL